MAHPNEDLIRDVYAAYARGDIDSLRQDLAPDVRWHFPGTSPLAGQHQGTDTVAGVFGLLSQLSGKITEAWTLHTDPRAVDEFWS